MKSVCASTVAVLALALGGTGAPGDSLPLSRAAAYLTAFNSGEQAMQAFVTDNFAARALAARPAAERVATYRQMKQDLGSLTAKRGPEAHGNAVYVTARAANGAWFRLDFDLDPGGERKLLGIRIQPVDEPPDPALPKVTEQQVLDSIDAFLTAEAKAERFAGAVLIARNDKKVYEKALGPACREFGVPNRFDTKFNLGSINKLFTKIAIGQLVEQGKLAFGDTLGKYLPDYPNPDARRKVTVRHLLNMTSGIGDFFGDEYEATPKDRIRTISDYLPLFAAKPLAFEPGSQRRYSNGGYVVLGAIIEKASGQSYYDYVRENICQPAGMLDSDFYEADIPVPNLAKGYTRGMGPAGDTTLRSNIYMRPARGSSAGGGYSTVGDLLKLATALRANRFMSPGFTNWLFNDAEPGAGQGGEGPRDLVVAGGAPGTNAVLRIDGRTGHVTIVLANLDPQSAELAERKIQGWLSRQKS